MLSIQALTVSLSVIPEELSPRDPLLSPMIGLALFAGFLLIALSKLIKPNVFEALAVATLKVQGLSAYLRDVFPLNRGGSFLLILNYIVSFSLVLYLMADFSLFKVHYQWWEACIVPGALLLWSLGSMLTIGLITGERQVFAEPLAMKIVGAEILGLLYFSLALVLSLYSIEEDLFIQIVVFAFVIESAIRLIKSIASVVVAGISWYYIILYFCTLEILPLFVVYYALLKDFVDN